MSCDMLGVVFILINKTGAKIIKLLAKLDYSVMACALFQIQNATLLLFFWSLSKFVFEMTETNL